MSKPDVFYSPCEWCKRETRHQVLSESVERGNDDYRCERKFSVIECLGCEGKSFRQLFIDYENAYPDHDDEWTVPQEATYYPKYSPNHVEIENVSRVPEIVREIYQESIAAVQAGALTLSGLGLRGTIEAVCNDQKITGKNLELRIRKMATQGLVSVKDADRLHAIRFLGNDAAHEIKKPSEEQLSVALKIVNHLLQSIYILDKEMNRKLDTIVSDRNAFIDLLNKNLKEYSSGDEYPLAKFLGRDMRRLGAGASALEELLILEIGNSEYSNLSVGKIDKYFGSKDPVQHFILK